jgi:hypothetical protein
VADLERWAGAGLDRLLLADLGPSSRAVATLEARAEQLSVALR